MEAWLNSPNAFSMTGDQIRAALPGLDAFLKQLESIDLAKMFEQLQDGVRANTEIVRTVAAKGWTIPGWMDMHTIQSLADFNGEQLDAFFTEAYTVDRFKRLRDQTDELVTTPEMSPWKPLLREISESIVQGRHLVVVPALLTILEGFAFKELLHAACRNGRETNLLRLFEKAGYHTKDAILWMPAISNFLFMESLFESSDFNTNRPNKINRHWILHGRDDCNWTLADALRLIAALETLVWISGVKLLTESAE